MSVLVGIGPTKAHQLSPLRPLLSLVSCLDSSPDHGSDFLHAPRGRVHECSYFMFYDDGVVLPLSWEERESSSLDTCADLLATVVRGASVS